MTRKKGLIGRRMKREKPRKQHKQHLSADVLAEDLLSKSLGDTFFVKDGTTESDETPLERVECFDSDGCHADEFFVILDKPYRYCPDTDLDEFVENESVRIFSEFRENCKRQITNDNFTYMKSSNDLKFIQLYDTDKYWDSPRVKTCVCVARDFKIHISVHGKEIPDNHFIWNSVRRYCTSVKDMEHVLEQVEKFDICCGNQDSELQNLIPVGTFLDVKNDYKFQGYRESFYIGSTIRATKCSLLINTKTSNRCEHCNTYRRTLRKTLLRRQNTPKIATPKKDWIKSKIPNSKLTENQMFHKIKQLKEYSSQLESEVARLKREVKKKIQKEGVVLSDCEGQDLIDIMENSEREVHQSYPDENSYQRIFWEQQRKNLTLKNKHGMRWHPAIIKWCIFLKSKSSSTYDALKNSGFITLPSERTLFDYTNITRKGTGFQADIVEMLINEMNGLESHKRVVGILQDEVKIKRDLVYNRHTGQLIGFVDLGNMGNDLDQIQESDSQRLAKYVLVLMVRGISTNLKFPLAHFATTGVTSDQLFCVLWEAIEILETDVNLEVLFITSDGASPNRRFIKLHQPENAMHTVFSSMNIFAPMPREIYFISDPPHLIKTARNCFSNSFSHKKRRFMWKDGFDISWLHIVNLFKDHCSGLYRLCPKLTRDHINVSSFGAMKVRYATQVLSETVATALEMHYDQKVTESVKFIRHMNKFFDCLNVRHLGEAARTRNPHLKEYRSVDDERLKYLSTEFLGYFNSWKQSVENRQGQFSKMQRNGMMLSYQTLEGLEITVNSVIKCVQYCLNSGMEFVLTERFNQDPIEQHFGLQRANCGSNTNPNLQEFNNSMVQLRTVGSQVIAPFRGNTARRRLDLPTLDQTPLCKRKRHNST